MRRDAEQGEGITEQDVNAVAALSQGTQCPDRCRDGVRQLGVVPDRPAPGGAADGIHAEGSDPGAVVAARGGFVASERDAGG